MGRWDPSVAGKKIMLIGLDCAEPSLVLERWRSELPELNRLMERGTSGRLTSVIPPITVPAWSCMMSSRTPGDLGVYGFRNRADYTYDSLTIATSAAIREPRLWDLATRAGKPSIVLGVPGTYPPRPLNGVMVSCFLTPSLESQYTYPATLRREVEATVGEYVFDCTNFRTEDKDDLLRQVYTMTDRRFALAEHLLASKPWELFAMVEMGTDRMHHGFWKYMDPAHRKHVAGGPYEDAILDYHRHVDELVGRLLAHADENTVVLVVSDHGAKRMDGGIRVNEWLRREGLLTLRDEPAEADAARARRGRLVPYGGLGRGRLLLPRRPQRQGPGARGHRRPRGLRAGSPRPGRTARRHPRRAGPGHRHRRLPPGGASTRRCGESRPISSSTSAISSGARSARSAAAKVSTPSRTTPAPTTRTMHRTGSSWPQARVSRPARAWTPTCSTSPPPSSS